MASELKKIFRFKYFIQFCIFVSTISGVRVNQPLLFPLTSTDFPLSAAPRLLVTCKT